jgi:Fungal specific transcription factor domain
LLGENNELLDNVPQPHIDSFGLATLLKSLPNKAVCDILLFSFLVGVRPIHPLIHTLTFRTDYNNFWQWRQNSEISLPDNKLLDDPTFLCLLFSVLYCGAATAPSPTWAVGVLQGMRRETMVEQLKTAFYTSLKLCQHLQHPTFNTLVSSLLAHSCSKQCSESMDDLSFVRKMARVAQSMGLHRDGALFGLDMVTCELRRRVWWHIVWLDVQASILNGSQTCFSGIKLQSDVKMVAETRDEDIPQSNRGFLTRAATLPSGASSVIMLFAIGRYETARFKHFLIDRLHSVKGLEGSQFDEFVTAAKKLNLTIDGLTARIPAQGFPEGGFIPSRLANASPLTHERLYGDHASQPTVFTTWTRIVLKMMKTEVTILLRKQFLGRADAGAKEGQRMWHK